MSFTVLNTFSGSLILDGSITNADISSSAAIAYSKLALTGGIVNADISASAAIVGSKLDLSEPGAIGGTTAAAGTFTTINATSIAFGDEALSTYNQGTWTPAVSSSGGGESVAYTTQTGIYTQIGNVVHYKGKITISTVSGGSGNLQISAPIASANDSLDAQGSAMLSGVDVDTGAVNLTVSVQPNSTNMLVFVTIDNAARANLAFSGLANGDEIRFSGIYFV